MAQVIWKGSISFGLVNIPVGLYSAVHDSSVRFHQFQRGTSDRVRYERVNERTGDEVPYHDIVKGQQVGDTIVIVEPDELDAVAPGRSTTIEITGFVELADIDPLYFGQPYYLAPASEGNQRTYALLAEAISTAGRAGIAEFVMRGRQYLTALRARDGVLVLQTLYFADELRDPRAELPALPKKASPSAAETRAAVDLIETMAADWDPTAYHDSYRERVSELIHAKSEGETPRTGRPARQDTNVVDLVSTLRRSIKNSTNSSAAPATRKAGKPTASKKELYARATELGIPGRSGMDASELAAAIRAADRHGRGRGKAS